MLIDIIKRIDNLRFSTAPLFKIENGIPIIQGTCTFIKYKSQYFILTAYHVLESFENNLYISSRYNSKSLIRPGGESYVDKKNDIGVIILDDETRILIEKTYKFIDIISSNSNKNVEILNAYSFIGFPESRGRFNKYKVKSKIVIEPFIYTTEVVKQEVLMKYDFDFKDKIYVYYEKDKVYNFLQNKIKTGPDLYGISGCLLIAHNTQEYSIIGILTEWFVENRKILIGVRFHLIENILSYAVNKNIK